MAVAARGEPGGTGDINLLAHINSLLNAQRDLTDRMMESNDLRYQQRYDAQQKALEAALLAAEKAVQAALVAAEKAVTKAELAAERRFESVNEFRGQLADQATLFMPRAEYESAHTALEDKLNSAAARVDRMEAVRQGGIDQRTAIYAMIFLIIAVIGLWTATH